MRRIRDHNQRAIGEMLTKFPIELTMFCAEKLTKAGEHPTKNVRPRGEAARKFIVENVEKHPSDIVKVAAEHFACSRQAMHRHVQHLLDERHSVLELSKGKFTTDPSRHTGEGIFFSSRMFDDFGFTKTVVPVKLTQYGDDNLVSRSQAKRLLARIDRFKVVVFDFEGVDSIGQPFADEVFRVFAKKHPEIEITRIHANAEVNKMISRALVSDSL